MPLSPLAPSCSKRDAVLDAYRWDLTVDKTLIPSFRPEGGKGGERPPVPQRHRRGAGPRRPSVRMPTVPAAPTSTVAHAGRWRSAIDGQVVGPDNAPIPGATVRIERFVGDSVVTVDLASSASAGFAVNQRCSAVATARGPGGLPTFAQLAPRSRSWPTVSAGRSALQLAAPNDIDISASALRRR
ncbi:MAG: hypothetical protein R2749_15695 [Acidimicrobiales bacterium]